MTESHDKYLRPSGELVEKFEVVEEVLHVHTEIIVI
jgi:hypothetical protein